MAFVKTNRKLGKREGEKLHFDVKGEGEEVENLCSCLCYFPKFIFICTEKQFQEKVLPCPDNKLFACKQSLIAVPIFFPTSSFLFLLFLPSYLFTLGLHFPAFVLSSFSLSCPLGPVASSHTTQPILHKLFSSRKPGTFCPAQHSAGRAGSHAAEDNRAHHTHICIPVTHKPGWTARCSL